MKQTGSDLSLGALGNVTHCAYAKSGCGNRFCVEIVGGSRKKEGKLAAYAIKRVGLGFGL